MDTKEAIIAQIKGRGERITLPRRAVIETLCNLGGHQTIQNIRHALEREGVSMPEPTIYRVLQWLKSLSLVTQTDLGHSGIVYELLTSPPHHHLVCLTCGRVLDLDDEIMNVLRQHINARHRFLPRIDHMAIFGECEDCCSRHADAPEAPASEEKTAPQ
ncbi:MAG: transcriptional repressor [Chloroflexi bacterium]|nr:transcriptional repressor [Chloroflexota bacterium]